MECLSVRAMNHVVSRLTFWVRPLFTMTGIPGATKAMHSDTCELKKELCMHELFDHSEQVVVHCAQEFGMPLQCLRSNKQTKKYGQ